MDVTFFFLFKYIFFNHISKHFNILQVIENNTDDNITLDLEIYAKRKKKILWGKPAYKNRQLVSSAQHHWLMTEPPSLDGNLSFLSIKIL